MKRTLALIMGLILTASALSACSDPSEFSKKENLSADYTRSTDPTENYNYNDAASSPSSYNNYSNLMTDFELKMFRNYYSLKESKNNSFVFSPASTALQLGLIANGASGDSKSEISLLLGGSELTVEDINRCSSYFISRMQAVSKSSNTEVDELTGEKIEETVTEYIKFDNNLFFNDTSDIKTSFLQTNSNFYGDDIFRFMFSDENSLTKINSHFSGFTKNNVISKLDENQTFISINATDINDTWLEPYAQSDIEKGTFKAADGEREVNYMTSNESYIKSNKAQGIIKYTSKNPLRLVLVMPNEGITLEDYIADFNNLEYSNLLESVDITEKVTAKIPEFSIASENSACPMSKTLTKSGLYSLFTDEATFSDMTYTDDFRLNEIYEVTPTVSVNAAGLGGATGNDGKAPSENRVKELEETETTVEFNRPFIFLVIDNDTNIPLYIGTVNN